MVPINIDFGEKIDFLDESLVLTKSRFCNIACGYHAGDALSIAKSIQQCMKHGVLIGAHPSYLDLVGFGRINSAASSDELRLQLIHQLAGFKAMADHLGAHVHHVKAHGSLYNDLMHQEQLANLFLDVTVEVFPDAAVMLMPGSAFEKICLLRQLPFLREGFGDRKYLRVDKLVPRSEEGALLTDINEILSQQASFEEGYVDTMEGGKVKIQIDTLCFHGDHPLVNEILKAIAS